MKKAALYPAIRAQMGDWWYYVATLTFQDVADRVSRVDDIVESDSLKTWIQRKIDDKRRSEIAAYLNDQKQHFFNAIVLGIFDGSPDWYPVDVSQGHVKTGVVLSDRAKTAFGLIKLTGTEQIFAIDGQHRVEGIKEAVAQHGSDLALEELTVILVAHKPDAAGRQRTRRLFTTLNRYAVRVSQAELIALSEDDSYAIVARRLVDEYPGFGSEFVPLYRTANIPKSDKQSVTSLISLYTVVKVLSVPSGKRSPRNLIHGPPNKVDIERILQLQIEFWDGIKVYFSELKSILNSEPENKLAGKFRHQRGGHFLLRTFCLVAFAKAVRVLVDRGNTVKKAVRILSNSEMEISTDPWNYMVWNPLRHSMINKHGALVKNLLLHQAGESLSPANFNISKEFNDALGGSSSSYCP